MATKKSSRVSKDMKNAPQKASHSLLRSMSLVAFALFAGILHSYHVDALFESDRHFSHLGEIEREMSFRTEMGLYYSYYKRLVSAPSLAEGVHALMRDNLTEYPDTINVLQRFNLYPEVLLSVGFRMFTSVSSSLDLTTIACFRVDRGEDLASVISCEGIGDLAIFYVKCVFVLAAITTAALFLIAVLLSDSVAGGLLCVLCFFFNHGECTRVQWTPPLRESFAYPVFVAQMLSLCHLICQSKQSNSRRIALSVCFIASTTWFLITWQLAPFVLSTQIGSLFILYVVQVLKQTLFKNVIESILISISISLVLLFGNRLLLSSWLCAACISALTIVLYTGDSASKDNTQMRILRGAILLLCFGVLTISVRAALTYLLQINDDAHVFNLLRSKLTSYSDFDTLLYTCAPEFDFLDWEMPLKTSKTLLLPSAFVASLVFLWQQLRLQIEGDLRVVVWYQLIQTACFGAMALLIMRLKLFFTPQLCILTALLARDKILSVSSSAHVAILVALVAAMSVGGFGNLKEQHDIVGEFSDPAMEELIDWINANLPKDAALAGPMPLMANLLLSTGRPVVNHPHYEDAGLRARTRRVYSVFSRQDIKQVYDVLKNELKAHFLVLTASHCLSGNSEKGCSMLDIWDRIEPGSLSSPPLCPKLFNNRRPHPFHRRFANANFVVLQI